MDQGLKKFALSIGIDQIGIAPARVYHEAEPFLYPAPFCDGVLVKDRINPFLIMPEAKSVLVYLIPYYNGKNPPHNLSRYAWGRDYHEVAKELSLKLEQYLKKTYPNYQGIAACDITPLPQKHLAYLAGLGFFGEHHLLINPKYGTYFFIAHILTNLSLPIDSPLKDGCLHCGACRKACPSGTLFGEKPADFYRCISAVTQKKAPLSKEEESFFKESVWGCDICQMVCPYNRHPAISPLLSHFGNEICVLTEESVFPKDRAYSYRRKKFMQRNLSLYHKARVKKLKDTSETPD